MATILDKDLIRESTVKVDEREILVTLTETQKISMKLKGMKSGTVEIGIGELYGQLTGSAEKVVEKVVDRKGQEDLSAYKGDDNMLISLHDMRHYLIVNGTDMESVSKFDAILSQMIRDRRERSKPIKNK